MRKLNVGESYTGNELAEILGIVDISPSRLYAFDNEKDIVVAQDEGNDNYKVLAVLEMPV